MALKAITVARRHGSDVFEVIADPSIHPNDHKQEFRAIAGERTHPEFAEVQIWTSDQGIANSRKFRDPNAQTKPEGEGEISEGDTSAKTTAEPKSTRNRRAQTAA